MNEKRKLGHKELVCIVCPTGCRITADADGDAISIKGNTCKRGEDYARAELLAPMRGVTTIIPVKGGDIPFVSAKTSAPVPKALMLEVVRAAGALRLTAPVAIGDVLLENVLGTGSNIVATKKVKERSS